MFRSATCATSPIQLYDDDDDVDDDDDNDDDDDDDDDADGGDDADDADDADGGDADDLRHSSTPSHAQLDYQRPLGNVIIISVIQFGIIGH